MTITPENNKSGQHQGLETDNKKIKNKQIDELQGKSKKNKGNNKAGEKKSYSSYPLTRSGKAYNARSGRANRHNRPVYGALDLGTNNCRLLLAYPSRRGFTVVDAFSRIIRLGEGVNANGHLSDNAMKRTIEALKICSNKMRFHQVARSRLVATEACRVASNSDDFINRVAQETGLQLEIVPQETEARLAVSGCASLIDIGCDNVLVFDIGGGSSELIWLTLNQNGDEPPAPKANGACEKRGEKRQVINQLNVHNLVNHWTSLPVGVVTLAEMFGVEKSDCSQKREEHFQLMVKYVRELVAEFAGKTKSLMGGQGNGNSSGQVSIQFLGTSGTVTTLAGVHQKLRAYDRQKVDGYWMGTEDVRSVANKLIYMTEKARRAEPCIGSDRSDLVVAGCAILEALMQSWPCHRLRVADRGLREGILAQLMAEDGFIKPGKSWTSQSKKNIR